MSDIENKELLVDESKINDPVELNKKIDKMAALIKNGRQQIYQISMRMNDLEKENIAIYNKLDQVTGLVLGCIEQYGNDGVLILSKRVVDCLLPGSGFSDKEDNNKIILTKYEKNSYKAITQQTEPQTSVDIVEEKKEITSA